MFVSTNYLVIQFGVDEQIAKFFVDREPPANNLYWHEKLLYLRFQPGYLFLPLIVDLYYKLGVEKDQLLSEKFVQLLEAIGHISALEETKQLTNEAAIDACAKLAEAACEDHAFVDTIVDYFNGVADHPFAPYTTPFKALHRGDLFLFSLAALQVDHHIRITLVKFWFALISSLLLLDDAEDINADLKNKEENAFIESGMDENGFHQLKELVQKNLQLIETVNTTMAKKVDSLMVSVYKKPHFLQHFNYEIDGIR